ncbi:MAG: succinyldiaminopimelate transaminase [Gammaproteobacteria bacterium]|jgi:N-succinyldiaminopimelate aminotransferase|nr:succinyldiaminopimelate transaminase [Gammaproteobacteria bacterium]
MNPDLERLQAYPFEKLAQLLQGTRPTSEYPRIDLAIGEPQHPSPSFVTEEVISHLHGMSRYPTTRGENALREAIAGWLQRRFGLPSGGVDPERQVLPVNGTREALFAFAQAIVDRTCDPLVLMPNPFYQIYEGAALLAGAEPRYVPAGKASSWLPDFEHVTADEWQRCQLLYLCSPGNPSGAVIGLDRLCELIELAERHDFVIASDECYSEIYTDEAAPPPGLLQAAAAMGNDAFRRCMVFHSLSKRSSVPGLRSGFVAGDAALIERFLLYRTYHGCAMPLHVQAASAAAWSDEEHVRDNRALYREKFEAVLPLLAPALEVERPAAGFYLWAGTPGDDAVFARALFERRHVRILPGSYLSRVVDGADPGAGRVRIALVAPVEDCIEAARRMVAACEELRATR